MHMTSRLIAELRDEATSTRRLLERIPEAHLAWRPHEKSMSLGQLALHVAVLPLGIAMLVTELAVEVPTVPLPEPASTTELLESLDRSIAFATAKLEAWGDDGLEAQWTLTAGGAVILTMSRHDVLRSLMFSHVYHHRGQLTVYLRLLGIAVPPIYGPTADESPFG